MATRPATKQHRNANDDGGISAIVSLLRELEVERLALHRDLILSPQASGTQANLAWRTVHVNGRLLDIGKPPGSGPALGMAYVIPRLP